MARFRLLQRDPLLLFVKIDLAYDALRSDPRHPALLSKMNLV